MGDNRKEYDKEYYEKNKERHKEYAKEYYEKNNERLKEHNKEYYEKNKERHKEYAKEYYEKNKERLKEHNKEYREKNKERIKEYRKEYWEKNRERLNESHKEYNEKNQHKINGREHKISEFTYASKTKSCFICGWTQNIHLHHINKNHKDTNPKNLIGLCPNHHMSIHSKKYHKQTCLLIIKKCFENIEEITNNY